MKQYTKRQRLIRYAEMLIAIIVIGVILTVIIASNRHHGIQATDSLNSYVQESSIPSEKTEEVTSTDEKETQSSLETVLPAETVESSSETATGSKEPWMAYTDADVTLLGDLMYAEEGVLFWKVSYEEAKKAHLLAGSVVLHRMASHQFPNSLEEVIFSSGYAQSTQRRIRNKELTPPAEVYEWAEELLKNGPIGPKTLFFQAQFKQGVEVYAHIYNQYFCLGIE